MSSLPVSSVRTAPSDILIPFPIRLQSVVPEYPDQAHLSVAQNLYGHLAVFPLPSATTYNDLKELLIAHQRRCSRAFWLQWVKESYEKEMEYMEKFNRLLANLRERFLFAMEKDKPACREDLMQYLYKEMRYWIDNFSYIYTYGSADIENIFWAHFCRRCGEHGHLERICERRMAIPVDDFGEFVKDLIAKKPLSFHRHLQLKRTLPPGGNIQNKKRPPSSSSVASLLRAAFQSPDLRETIENNFRQVAANRLETLPPLPEIPQLPPRPTPLSPLRNSESPPASSPVVPVQEPPPPPLAPVSDSPSLSPTLFPVSPVRPVDSPPALPAPVSDSPTLSPALFLASPAPTEAEFVALFNVYIKVARNMRRYREEHPLSVNEDDEELLQRLISPCVVCGMTERPSFIELCPFCSSFNVSPDGVLHLLEALYDSDNRNQFCALLFKSLPKEVRRAMDLAMLIGHAERAHRFQVTGTINYSWMDVPDHFRAFWESNFGPVNLPVPSPAFRIGMDDDKTMVFRIIAERFEVHRFFSCFPALLPREFHPSCFLCHLQASDENKLEQHSVAMWNGGLQYVPMCSVCREQMGNLHIYCFLLAVRGTYRIYQNTTAPQQHPRIQEIHDYWFL